MSIQISWKGKKFDVQIRTSTGDPGFHIVTLGDLLEKCSTASGVPADRIKLLTNGGEPDRNRGKGQGGKEGLGFFEKMGRGIDSFVDWVSGESDSAQGSYVVMKDPRAPLANYGIRQGSKVMMIGDAQ
ncbi:hypothetical protein HK101_003343, partial [Irineochytrium annulatum]